MGAVLNKTAYEWNITVSGYDVDMYKRLTLSALMKYHQEIGEKHLGVFGTDSNTLTETQKIAFIFTKIGIKIHRLPSLNEKITLCTWCSELKGVRFTRNYVTTDENGKVLTEAKGEVATIDLVTRKIIRPKNIVGFESFLYNDTLENGCEYPEKIDFTATLYENQTRKIRFSDLDYNGHVNNTVYASICMDLLPKEIVKKPIKSFVINFKNEIIQDELLNLKLNITNNDVFITGICDGVEKFSSAIKFQ